MLESKILFSCSGIMILKYKNSVPRAQLKLKSGLFRSDPPNVVSHDANLNVKRGYIMVPRELRWCHRCWLIRSHCLSCQLTGHSEDSSKTLRKSSLNRDN